MFGNKTSASTINTDIDFVTTIEASQSCNNCNISLEEYGKYYSPEGGVSGTGWHRIAHLVSPVSNLCPKCYSEKQERLEK
jgi:hypothetical protein